MTKLPTNTVYQWTQSCMRCCHGIFSAVLLCCTAFVIVFGIVVWSELGGPVNVLSGYYQPIAVTLFCFAFLYFSLSIFGILSLMLNSPKFLTCMTYLGLTLSAVQMLTGFLCVGVRHYLHTDIGSRMNYTQMNYLKDFTYQHGWNTTQNLMKCCGVHSSNEWFRILGFDNLPDSCCINKFPGCGLEAFSDRNYYSVGCFGPYTATTSSYVLSIVIFGFVMSFFHLLLVAVPLYLVKKIEEYDNL
ncbi:CD63 antigen-like [Argonauta hians]